MLLKRDVFLFASDSAGGIVPVSWHNAGKTEKVANIIAIVEIAPEQSRRFRAPFHISIPLQLVDRSENLADHTDLYFSLTWLNPHSGYCAGFW
jgi:hypothetical protein